MRILPFVLLFSVLASCKAPQPEPMVKRHDLSAHWVFRDKGEAEWHAARVPGTVHTDLRDSKLIEDPYFGCNEEQLQWIGERTWIYKTVFSADSSLLTHQHKRLVFEGLDTYARVYLNGEEVLAADNMHRRWEVDCANRLVLGDNTLEIEFLPVEEQVKQDFAALGHWLPGGQWAFARKAAYHFGWDWGPRFLTMGIHKPVYLELWNNHRPGDFYISTKSVDEQQATLELRGEVWSDMDEEFTLKINHKNTGKMLHTEQLQLAVGGNGLNVPFTIHKPKLWWTNGLGEPHIYDLVVELTSASGYEYKETIPVGIRTLRAVFEDDEQGKALYFELNGQPVYMKGANYIPSHFFTTDATPEYYQMLIETAKESNMNMLRIWGGGIYEDDLFYELCNRNGLLVWQDFMFACAMYPYNSLFVENVKQEAVEQVKRLRRHSNIALWCGNNEVDEAWHNWGWHRGSRLTKSDSTAIWEGYKTIFHQILPHAVEQYDPQRQYISTSPMFGWGRESSMTHGSAHYWGVWWGVLPIERYVEKVPRFMSEFGLQALPSLSTIHSFQPTTDDTLFSPSLKCHQKHKTGFETIAAYLKHEGLDAQTLEQLIYFSQLQQAKGIGLGIEAQRRAKPYCMGSLYWQLNDCWPVTSWSSTDYHGNWKALQYKAKELYDDILVTMIEHNDTLQLHVVSDRLTSTQGVFTLYTIDSLGSRKVLYNQELVVESNASVEVLSEATSYLLKNFDRKSVLVEAAFTDDKGKTYRNQKFLVPLGEITLPVVEIEKVIKPVEGGYQISLSSNILAAYVQLYLTDTHANFSQNFMHILPGEPMEVFCKTMLPLNQFEEQLQIVCLNNTTLSGFYE